MTKLKKIKSEVERKKAILDRVSIILKEEFFGIDAVIDELLKYVSYWYLFPGLINRPVIINLWGMTGVGKTSLVQRLASLINHSDKLFRFDLGEAMASYWGIRSDLEEIAKHSHEPVIISLDEFQHARTLDLTGLEIEKSSISVIWDLLDSGKYSISNYSSRLEELNELYYQLGKLVKKGVTVKNGIVIKGKDLFKRKMDEDEDRDGKLLFIPEDFHDDIYELLKDKFDFQHDLVSHMLTLTSYESLNLIKDAIIAAMIPKEVDCTKALIFVMGNLDEAYEMSGNYSADINANDYYEHSLKINISKIKRALQCRFRNEQIARLGNLHIIYPSLCEDAYKKIIEVELEKVNQVLYQNMEIEMQFEDSVKDIIYKEGVYPTLGTRPVFTTIHQIINSNIGQIFTEAINFPGKIATFNIGFHDQHLIVKLMDGEKQNGVVKIKVNLKLHELRKTTKDDLQAITAVHECGHAVVSIALLDTIPEVIHSKTSDYGTNGFVHTKFKWKYISKKEILARTALFLAGRTAEKVIFGEENLTTGSEDDISKATSFISAMLKSSGMGNIVGTIQVRDHFTNHCLFDDDQELNNQIRSMLIEADELAEKVILDQKELLIKMAEYLADNSSMLKNDITAYKEQYYNETDGSPHNNQDHYYRKQLFDQSKKITRKLGGSLTESSQYLLNSKESDEEKS